MGGKPGLFPLSPPSFPPQEKEKDDLLFPMRKRKFPFPFPLLGKKEKLSYPSLVADLRVKESFLFVPFMLLQGSVWKEILFLPFSPLFQVSGGRFSFLLFRFILSIQRTEAGRFFFLLR